MKIIGYMAAYNEAEFIEYAMRSTINSVDSFVAIEGAFKETVDAGGTLRSNDGTLEILDLLTQEFSRKLNVVPIPLAVQQLQHRNFIFDYIPYCLPSVAQQDYWLWLIDADEVYKEEDIVRLKEILDKTKADVIKIDSLTFVNTFKHYVKIAFPRLFRIKAGHKYRFVAPNHIVNETERKLLQEENHENEVKFFHYSYCKNAERFLLKKQERTLVNGNFKWYLDGGRVTADGINLREFNGTHPEVMSLHRLNNANWDI